MTVSLVDKYLKMKTLCEMQDWLKSHTTRAISSSHLHETLQESAISHRFPLLQIVGTHDQISALI
jgi:hypothetical protein